MEGGRELDPSANIIISYDPKLTPDVHNHIHQLLFLVTDQHVEEKNPV